MAHEFNISVAEMTFHIDAIHQYAAYCCRDYWIDYQGEYAIVLSQEDIDKERAIFLEEISRDDGVIFDPSDPYLETIALLRKLTSALGSS